MKEVSKNDYIKLYNLFRDTDFYVGVLGVLDGICNGKVFVDSVRNPLTAIMMTEDGIYLAGDYKSDAAVQMVKSFIESNEFDEYSGLLFSEKISAEVIELFSSKLYQINERNNYVLSLKNFKEVNVQVGQMKLVKITPENLEDFKDYQNYKTLYDGCSFFWGEYQKSQKMNVCIALINDDSIVSKCIVCQESTSKNCCELDVETIEEYRGNGYAVAVVNATLKEVIKQGYQAVHWNCDKDNHGSRKTAEKFNFKLVGESYLALCDKKL